MHPSARRVLDGAAIMVAVLLWLYGAWGAAYLIDRGLQGFPSASAVAFDLVLGMPLGVLLPLAAGWTIYAARVRVTNVDRQAQRLLGRVLGTFGLLWVMFAGACTVSGGFSGRPQLMMDDVTLLSAALILAYGAAFLIVGWRLRR